MKNSLIVFILFFAYGCNAQSSKIESVATENNQKQEGLAKDQKFNYNDWLLQQSVPSIVKEVFFKNNLLRVYSIVFSLNPFYLRGNFNADQYWDYAITIKQNSTGKIGILIVSSNDGSYQIIGAGNTFNNGGDDFKWMNIWYVYEGKEIEARTENDTAIHLKSEGIWVEKSEAASAIIYWDGGEYKEVQQGD